MKEHTIRRKDLRGDHEASGAMLLIRSRIWVMCGCANTAGSLRLVIRSVLVGFAGWIIDMLERSSVRCDARDDARDRLGEPDGERPGDATGDKASGESCVAGDSIVFVVWRFR